MARAPGLYHSNWHANEPTTLLHSVLGSRRCRKASLSGEEVWPVHLEAALLEGLETYVPDESRETQILGRFRGRNRFIADYIFAKTGEQRTNKQVGSRLQQLRHCSTDPHLRRLLLPLGHASPTPQGSPGSRYSVSSESSNMYPEVNHPRTVIHISISSLSLCSNQVSYTSAHPGYITESAVPAVTLISARPISGHSYFSVWHVEEQFVHSETVPLVILKEKPHGVPGYLHSSVLVPVFWSSIVTSPDPSKFIITLDVVKDEGGTSAFSAEYRFV